MENARFRAVEQAVSRTPLDVGAPGRTVSQYYGSKVFGRKQMDRYLPKKTVQALFDAVHKGTRLEPSVADGVAEGMKQWASDMGVTHYTHWFHPLTGGTAEKHDAFVHPDGRGGSIEEFSGKLLVQQEPDASSFPSGGLRNTFEARGYTAWDPSSPAFIIEDTLCIPTIFISYNGEALDHKLPLLRSIAAVGKAAADVARYFDDDTEEVTSYLGIEQEFFLVDAALYAQRPDLMLTERTLMGHGSARSQQLDDHYFGSIPPRVLAFMRDLETECYKLAIPIKTRHNEVAPNQFELAPVYEEMNMAVDHNLMLMSLMRKVAVRHGFRVLLHEKPFEGVNGSGKHCNWSLGTDKGVDLMAPGRTDREILRFLTFITNVLTAVRRNDGLIKASIASASNERRLGANEAPPAIMSVFLGEQIEAALDALAAKKTEMRMDGRTGLKLNLPHIPEILLDNTDRNRTSPFAFTGNRFEFRAVGSSANCALPMTVINTAVADQLVEFKGKVDARISKGAASEDAVLDVIREYLEECRGVCFEGNGYSREWTEEAKVRGIDCETSVPRMYDAFTSERSVKAFTGSGVLSEVELRARNEVWWEVYAKKTEIEARVLCDLSSNHVLPVATRYQSVLLDNVSRMKEIFPEAKMKEMARCQSKIIEDISGHISKIRRMVFDVNKITSELSAVADGREKAIGYHDRVLPQLESIREHADALEMIVDDQMWPLPKYREMMFIS